MRITFLFVLLSVTTAIFSQPTGYYNGTEGKSGDDLKTALHEIIDDHVAYSYFAAKTIMKFSDVDPANPDNVILVYTGRSQANNTYGTGANDINREHVWAKSHGNFEGVAPMYGDVHNLKPADASVNQSRSNKDFDNGGVQHPEATGCYYTDSSWEPRDEVKGDIARIIFYMDARYEGTNGELNLTVVDAVNTYPLPEHGRLSTLLEWNLQDPPDDFERNRNNVIFSWQKNRNPFIDNPEFAQLIWGGQTPESILFGNFAIMPVAPVDGEAVTVTADVTSGQGQVSDVKLLWGTDPDNLNNTYPMQSSGGDAYEAEIPGQNGETTVYYRIKATDATGTQFSITYNYYVAPVFNGTIVTIYDIEGQAASSPYEGEVVSTTGIVTANFGENYFIQDGPGAWNGLYVYDPGRNPSIGDSLVITGKIEEYYDKTEIKEISGYYHITSNNPLPEPELINTGDAGEAYESVLVKVSNAICTDDDYHSNYYMWKVDDGSGEMLVHNTSIFEFEPVLGKSYDVTGPLNFDFDEWKIEIRFESDVQDGQDIFPPEVDDLDPVNDNMIKVTYTENVDEVSATDAANYSLNNGVTVESVEMHSFLNNVVYLNVSKMNTGDYVLTINNVEDLAGNKMENVETEFHYEGTGIEEIKGIAGMELYPNPAMDEFTVSITAKENMNIRITVSDLTGKKLLQKAEALTVGNNRFTFRNHHLSGGVYIVKLSSGNGTEHRKLIVR
jgi:endonuclease I